MVGQNYKSIEKRIEEEIFTPISRMFYEMACSYYGTVAGMFRIPTTARKYYNQQSLLDTASYDASTFAIGALLGIGTDLTVIGQSIHLANNGDFWPLGVWLGMNTISGIYEFGRMSTTKKEHKALKNLERKQNRKSKDKK